MNPSWTQETFITDCDNDAINADPNYPTPALTPTPTPTPCAQLNQSAFSVRIAVPVRPVVTQLLFVYRANLILKAPNFV
jgi:hypothetical protein